MISSMVGVSFSHGKSVQKRCIFGSGLFKAMETARPISCWTSSFVIPSFSAMISKYLSTEYTLYFNLFIEYKGKNYELETKIAEFKR